MSSPREIILPPPTDPIDVFLRREDASGSSLLEDPSAQHFGTADNEAASSPIHLQIGGRPVAQNLRRLYEETGRALPDEYEIYWDHEIWLLSHDIAMLPEEHTFQIDHLSYELRLPENATFIEVLPKRNLTRQCNATWRCEGDLTLNGQVTTSESENGGDVVGRLSLEVICPDVQTTGRGDAKASIVFCGSTGALTGVQSIIQTVLVDKRVTEIACAARLQAGICAINGIPLVLRGRWVPFTVDLGAC